MANKSGLAIDEIKEVLQKEYNRDNFIFIARNYLVNDFVGEIREYKIDTNSLFKRVGILGYSKNCDASIFEVYLGEGNEKKRVGMTQEMFSILKNYGINNAIVAFVDNDEKHFRYSLLTARYEVKDKKVVKVLSNPKRYSYSLGFDRKIRTAFDYLINSGQARTFNELLNKFSVEVVNKEFYNAISNLYMKLVGGERNGEIFEASLKINSITEHKKFSEFAVRLIGRLIFCWFLKEKKSDKGKRLIPVELFDKNLVENSGNYYHDILEPLFFELLNTDKKYRKGKFAKEEIYNQVPYLNGGLFNPYDDDYYKYDKTSECGSYGVVTIKNQWFVELFEIFNLYNFTVDENTAYDIELSIDPEMLGRIFENLLAEMNPETGESARKNTGSFYTPREIVDFMVDNSLLEYLKIKTKIDELKLYNLIKWVKDDNYIVNFSIEEKNNIIDALYNIKTIDIACGSGAFPIGLLQKIVFILEQIDEDAKLWFDKTIRSVKDSFVRKEIKKKFDSGALNYIRKLKIIQNSIFGVDIQNIAVEIARLRTFLSLVIEDNVSDTEDNRGINPLPNLDFKFIIANSLISLPKTSNEMAYSIFEKDTRSQTEYIDELKSISDDYFVADVGEKYELISKFYDVQKQMHKHYNDVGVRSKKFEKLSNWEPFKNISSSWFDPSWMFGVEDGFDIVIGNPPYVQHQKSIDDNKTKCGDLYKDEGFKTFEKKGDLYCLFYEKGLSLLKENGTLTYITSNKWLRAGYGNKLRNYLANNSNPALLLDFGGNKVFKSATVDVNIMMLQKSENSNRTIACTLSSDADDVNLKEYVDENSSKISFNTESAWIISSDIETNIRRKIEEIGTPLKDWDIQINYGIKTGCNEAFIISGEKRAELIKEDPQSAEIIRPILRGRDIKRYGYEFHELYLINTHNGIKSKGILPIDINDYFAIKKHLDKYWDKISIRDDQGDTPYNLRNCIYTDLFMEQKIIYSELVQKPQFHLDKENFYISNTGYIMNGKKLNILIAYLNSHIVSKIFKKFYSTDMGYNGFRYLKQYIELLPIPTNNIKNGILSKLNNDYDKEELISEVYNFNSDEREYLLKKC